MNSVPLYLMRHGAPETSGLLLGRTDAAPTDAGIAACVDQAGELGIERLITSDLLRASRAAEAIGARLGTGVEIDPRWRELDFGDWDGLSPKSVDADRMAAFWDDPDSNPPPQGERWSSLVTRVAEALAGLDGRPTLILTHGGAMRAALAHLCGFDQRQLWAFELDYAALLSLRIWPGDRPTAQIAGLWL